MKPRITILTTACTALLLTSVALPTDALAQRSSGGAHVRATPASAQRATSSGGAVRVASPTSTSSQRVAVSSTRVAPSSAQRVAVAGGVHTGGTVVVSGGYHYGHPYYPYGGYYGGYPLYPTYGFGVSFGFGYGYPYAYPYGYVGYPAPWYGPYPYYYDGSASLRLQVPQRNAEVFVDGYYAGVVDSFDGTFQRLYLEPGEHELELYLPGHRSIVQQLYLQPGKNTNVKSAMEPLAPGEVEPAKPMPEPAIRPSQPRESQDSGSGGRPYSPRPQQQQRQQQQQPPQQQRNTDVGVSELPPSAELAGYGTVALKVQPGPASITIDGERWEGPAEDEPLIVQLTAGPHVVTVQKDGFRQYKTEVNVRPGRTSTLNVALTKN